MPSDRFTRRRQGIIVLLVTVALLTVPAIAVATHVFSDVADGSTHAAGISYMAETGITAGCTPTRFCPNDNLTRAQMGTFLHRASGKAPGTPPSVNAATLSSDAVVTVSDDELFIDAFHETVRVTCPDGTVVVGGGGHANSPGWPMSASRPQGDRVWAVTFRKADGTGDVRITVWARCLSVGP